MEGSNRVEPLMRHENELKKKVLSVLVGAQMYKKESLRNVTRNELNKREMVSPLKINTFVASWSNLVTLS